jgi:glutathione-independent formaldehyde dehydrogenase
MYGEIIEIGRDVEFIRKGDIVSVPFNVCCGSMAKSLGKPW